MGMADSSTTITADNASSVVKSSYDDVNNALEGLLGNINTSGNSSNTPVWVPQPCPFANAPAGYILANGASFSASQYPQLGAAFPSGKVPDLRGLFIRGLDTTGTIDHDGASRSTLSVQEGSALTADGYNGNCAVFTGVSPYGENGTPFSSLGWDFPTVNPSLSLPVVTSYFGNQGHNAINGAGEPLGIARPKNMAWNYVFRAA